MKVSPKSFYALEQMEQIGLGNKSDKVNQRFMGTFVNGRSLCYS
jgi:hypothetical protein